MGLGPIGVPGQATAVMEQGLREDLRAAARAAKTGVETVTDAAAVGRLLREARGDSSAGSPHSIPEGLGQLLSGVGTAFGTASDLQKTAFAQVLGQLREGRGGGGDQSMVLMLVLSMQAEMQAVRQQLAQDRESTMVQMAQRETDRLRAEVAELKGNRGGPWDSMLMGITGQIASRIGQTWSTDPMESLTRTLQSLNQFRELLPGMGGEAQYSDGYLRDRETSRMVRASDQEHAYKMATLQAPQAVWSGIRDTVTTALEGAGKFFAREGFVPTAGPADPGADRAADEALAAPAGPR